MNQQDMETYQKFTEFMDNDQPRQIAKMVLLNDIVMQTRIWEWDATFDPQEDDNTILVSMRLPKVVAEIIEKCVETISIDVNAHQVKQALVKTVYLYGIASIATDRMDPKTRALMVLSQLAQNLSKEDNK